jgi:Secretory lipase
VPGDLDLTGRRLNDGPYAGFMIDALVGIAAAYPDLPLTSLLDEDGIAAVDTARRSCLIETLTGLAGTDFADLTTAGIDLAGLSAVAGRHGRTWGQVIAAQKLGIGIGPWFSFIRYRIGFPVLQYRGADEEIIPTDAEDGTRAAYCAAGITTQWNLHPGGHLAADGEAVPTVMAWLADRFAGRLTAGNC